MHQLSEQEKAVAAAQVDYFCSLVATRYEVDVSEIIELLQWMKRRKELQAKVKATAVMSIVGLVLSGIAMALWEGVKAMIRGGAR